MIKKLLLAALIMFSAFVSAQTNLVVIDRSNITTGSTDTGNTAGVSSVGFTRGSGIGQASGGNHTSNSWNATDAASAEAAGEYIQWSITALPTYTITISDLDIRVRRNNNGPQAWQIFYSFDGFATAGIPFTNEEVTPSSATNFFFDSGNTPSLPLINPTEGGTITFRLYAWNSNTNGGWFRIANGAGSGWADLGIASPGARIVGTAVTSSTNSTDSDIVTNGGETDNIDYISFDATSGLTTANAVQIGSFTIRDGGAAGSDTDSDPTILSDITFTVTNPSFIAALAIFNGGVSMGEVTSVTDLTEFTNLNGGSGISAPDNGTKSFDVYATFTSSVTDNEQIQLSVNSAITPSSGSSLFEFGDAGGAQTSITGDANRLEVDATSFIYNQNATDVNQFEPMVPAVEIYAVDSNSNLDLDYTDTVSFFTSGTFDPSATTSTSATNGVATFSNLAFSEKGTGFTITAFATGFINTPSAFFDVLNPYLALWIQDFDGSGPEWNVTYNRPFYDNGWGVSGFYGPIDIASASPIDWPFFSGTILGENDNGSTGWARLTFDNVDVTGFSNIKIVFDWQVKGYTATRDDVRYRVRINGTQQTVVNLFDGANGIPDAEGRVVIDLPDGTTNVGFWIESRNADVSGYSAFDNFRVVSEFDGLIYRDGTWFPSPPTSGTGTEDVIVNSGTYTVDAPIEVNDFTIEPGSSVEIDPGQTLRTNGTLTNNGTLTLNSSSSAYSSILPALVGANGTVNYNRFVNIVGSGSSGGNDLVSIPLMPDNGQTFDEYIGLGSPTTNADKLATNGSVYAFAPFNNTTNSYENFATSGTDALSRGVGYRVATTTGETLTFSGDIFTGDLTGVPISTPVGGSQWNLLGNPYPSYLDSQAFLAANAAALEPFAVSIYGYNNGTFPGAGTAGNFTIINFISNPTINLAPGQAFFVAAPGTPGSSGTIDFTSSMRTLTGDDDFILGFTESNLENLNFKLSLSSGSNVKITDIYFHENGSLGLDPGYDGTTFGNSIGNFDLYSHLIEENAGFPMMVQTLNSIHIENIRIPLGVHAGQGQQIRFAADYSNLPSDIEVILEDAETNTFTRLGSSDYVITSNSALSGTGRFYLNFGSNSLSTPERDLKNLHIYGDNSKQIYVDGQLELDTKALVYDLQGRLVIKRDLNTSKTRQTINGTQLNSGIYLVKLNNGISEHTVKIILK
ncbi:T9SS type A sorting domain-containing protein [Winogradskyella aurantiaca]|uniref:T9SS type A sorting domain-containing protein n=1 Tax=Winogradskyella aurantiaca TaxID=2219558 RepID=UPI000E1DF79C|nr:T9SS type A sorting domain-containing protein [Winogradskyella aurantiaca]